MKIAICDDEPLIREQLMNLLDQIAAAMPDVYASGEALLCAKAPYDLLFLDVELEGISGIEIAKRLRAQERETKRAPAVIVFVTAHASYVEDAFDVGAFHYLVKPVDAQRLARIVHRAEKVIIAREKEEDKTILVKAGSSMRRLRVCDITYVESSNKKVLVHTRTEVIETYARMREMEALLGSGFFRCHRCFLVNLEQVTAYTADTATVTGGDTVLIAGSRHALFCKALLRQVRGATHGLS